MIYFREYNFTAIIIIIFTLVYIQDLAGMAHDAIDPSVFSIRGDKQMVRFHL